MPFPAEITFVRGLPLLELGIKRIDEASIDLDQPRAKSFLLQSLTPAVSSP
jgi:hypothetical protein